MSIETAMAEKAGLIDKELDAVFPKNGIANLQEAVWYHIGTGGKRIRPVLAIATYEALGGKGDKILPFAAACEVLADGINALFVDPKSPIEIAQALETISQNPELYVSLCRNGRKLVEEKFTWTHYAKSLLCMFEDEYNRYKKI